MDTVFWVILALVVVLLPLLLGVLKVLPWKAVLVAYLIVLLPLGLVILAIWLSGRAAKTSVQAPPVKRSFRNPVPISEEGYKFITGRNLRGK